MLHDIFTVIIMFIITIAVQITTSTFLNQVKRPLSWNTVSNIFIAITASHSKTLQTHFKKFLTKVQYNIFVTTFTLIIFFNTQNNFRSKSSTELNQLTPPQPYLSSSLDPAFTSTRISTTILNSSTICYNIFTRQYISIFIFSYTNW